MYNMGHFRTERPRVYPMFSRIRSRLFVLASRTPVLLAALAVGCVDPDPPEPTDSGTTDSDTGEPTAGPTMSDSGEGSSSDSASSTTTESETESETDTDTTTDGTTSDVCTPMCVGDSYDDCQGEPEPCEIGCGSNGCFEVCVPGETICTGDTVEVCNEDGDGWEFDKVCDEWIGLACENGVCTGSCAELPGTNAQGCEFYPTVTANIIDDAEFKFTVQVANPQPVSVEVAVHHGDSLIEGPFEIPPNATQTIVLDWNTELKATEDWEYSRVVENGAYRLRAKAPVLVYQFNAEGGGEGADSAESNDASLLLPTNLLETSYHVMSYPSWPDPNSNLLMPGFYAVTAIHDGTYVDLSTFGADVVARPGAGVGMNGEGGVMLQRGDVLEVFSGGTLNAPGHLSGTRVEATKPVQVIAGHMCTGVPLNADTCNHLEESMYPAAYLGKDYLVVPPATDGNLDTAREQEVHILAVEDETTIWIDEDPMFVDVAAGQTIVLPPSVEPHRIHSNHTIGVQQFMRSPAPGEPGAPSMLHTQRIPTTSTKYYFAPPLGYDHVFVDILVAGKDPHDVMTEGAILTDFVQVGDQDLWYTRYEIPPNLYHAANSFYSISLFSVVVYGESTRGSAWYPAGLKYTSGQPGPWPPERYTR